MAEKLVILSPLTPTHTLIWRKEMAETSEVHATETIGKGCEATKITKTAFTIFRDVADIMVLLFVREHQLTDKSKNLI